MGVNGLKYIKKCVIVVVLFPSFVKFLRIINPRALTLPNQWFMDLAKKMIKDRLQTGVSLDLTLKCRIQHLVPSSKRLGN